MVVQKIGSIVGRFDGISETRRKIRRSIIRRTGRAFAQARFAFWIRPASWNARLRLTKQIENCEVSSGNALRWLISGSVANVEKRVVGQFELEDFAEC